ncbi:MAG: hypothetical protein L0229_12860 [Blastocatellia bacterium]|nr:hypothetical protein [Blastocatellia bacterium]
MNNEDTTQKLPEGFERILARLDSFEQNMNAQMDLFKRDMTARMDSFEQNMTARVDSFEQNMTERMNSFERNMNARMDSFDQRLTALEEKVEQRLLETRPVWEAVLAQLTEAQNDIRDIKYRLRALNDNILTVIAEKRHLEDRVDKLEHQPS